MRRLTTRPDRAPVTGPAAWFIRFVGVDGLIGPLGFGGFTIPAIISVAQGRGIIYVWGNPTYGDGPFERIGVPTTVLLLADFLAACLVQLVGAGLLIWLRPSGFIVMPAGMLLSAIFWWGFDLPLAWLGATLNLAFLAAAWLVYRRASRKLPAATLPSGSSSSESGCRRLRRVDPAHVRCARQGSSASRTRCAHGRSP